MPLNVIIIAALVLIVLVILAIIFSGRLKVFGGESKNCLAQGGKCASACAMTEGEAQLKIGTGTAIGCNTNQVCCLESE